MVDELKQNLANFLEKTAIHGEGTDEKPTSNKDVERLGVLGYVE